MCIHMYRERDDQTLFGTWPYDGVPLYNIL